MSLPMDCINKTKVKEWCWQLLQAHIITLPHSFGLPSICLHISGFFVTSHDPLNYLKLKLLTSTPF